MFIKKLFYASAAVLMLALAYHLGASTATAQASGNPVVAVTPGGYPGDNITVVTANGDVFGALYSTGPWILRSNVFSGVPVNTQQSSWGALKAKAR